MNEKVFSHITCVLTEKGCTDTGTQYPIPPCNASFDPGNIKDALDTVLSWQKHQRVLVITSSPAFCNLLLSLNQSIPKGKLAILCNGVLHDEDALREIEREAALLYTAAGTEHFPFRQLTECLYVDEDGNLLLKGADNGMQQLFSADGAFWGCILDPGKYTADRMVGELLNHLDGLSLRNRALLCRKILDMAEANVLPEPENLMMFRTDDGPDLLSTGVSVRYDNRALNNLVYSVYFTHTTDWKDKLDMLIRDRLANLDYPAFLFEDFTAAYSDSVFPCSRIHVPDVPLLRNTIDRILLLTVKE